jgi:hypothetical protein
MCNSWMKLLMGLWLIFSGFVSPLRTPENMIIVGFILTICCFRSYALWQAFITGILGIWLFMSGITYLFVHTHLVIPVNFLIVGISIIILGIACFIHYSKEHTPTPAL